MLELARYAPGARREKRQQCISCRVSRGQWFSEMAFELLKEVKETAISVQ
jgi:hypothetical protein